jgi:hypothetical protein
MVKSGDETTAKYAAKFDPTVVSARYTAGKDAAIVAQAVHGKAMAIKALAVRGLLNTAGVLPMRSMNFIGFSNKLYGICNKFTGASAIGQATIAALEWMQKMGMALVAGVPTIPAVVAPQIYTDAVVLGQVWSLYSSVLGAVPSPLRTL